MQEVIGLWRDTNSDEHLLEQKIGTYSKVRQKTKDKGGKKVF